MDRISVSSTKAMCYAKESDYGFANVMVLLFGMLMFSVLLSSNASAQEGHITLLTVSEGNNSQGGVADLYLRIEPGNGDVFVDSFPLTKLDTQNSIRYANRIACDYLEEDCSRYNFYYTIRANSAIVGGPSAGAAITVLTIGLLDGRDIDQKLAMTGTINSGGIVGPVAGIGKKVDGARAAGITTILIPALNSVVDESEESSGSQNTPKDISSNVTVPSNATNDTGSNKTRDVVRNSTVIPGANSTAVINNSNDSRDSDDSQIQKKSNQAPLKTGLDEKLSSNGVKVYRVATIEEALLYATKHDYQRSLPKVVPPEEYVKRMNSVAKDLCARTDGLRAAVNDYGLTYNDTNNYTGRALDAKNPYSKASLCFSANIELAKLELGQYSKRDRRFILESLKENLTKFEYGIKNKTLDTISDLETYSIVQERLLDTRDALDDMNATDPDPAALGYAQERFSSAIIWSGFFGMDGKKLPSDRQYLHAACISKLSDAEERASYIRMYAPSLLSEVDSSLASARAYSKNEPAICIFTASKAMAQANLLASALALDESNVDALIGQKLNAADAALRRGQQKGFFPIIGYSYMQYSSDLRDAQPYSSLSFAEYSLELSTFDIYFPKEHKFRISEQLIRESVLFLSGALFGAAMVLFFVVRSRPKQKALGAASRQKTAAKSKR